MPLADPPPPPRDLARLPRRDLRASTLHRVFSARRGSPWWFASLPPGGDPDRHGRFDLPAPAGACYLARTPVGAVLEAFQGFDGLLPDVELGARRRAEVVVPPDAPAAADLADRRARGLGATAALWAGGPRRLTQSWAVALHRAGWRAVHHGIAHDPAGRHRAVTLFDDTGEHAPYDDAEGWRPTVHHLRDDARLRGALAGFGIEVLRSDPQLPVVPLEETGLLG